jgi:single-stranded DNA-specific DHH superfamily exonuclease
MAAGVTLASSRLEDFRMRLNDLVRSTLNAEALRPALRLDGTVRLTDLTFPTVQLLDRLHPVGQGNPPVHLAAHSICVKGETRRFGAEDRHLRFTVSDGICSTQAVWWNCPQGYAFPPRFDLAFSPELNAFNGSFAIQLKVLDVRESIAS